MKLIKKSSPKTCDSSGFTLIELIVSVTILSIIMLSVFIAYTDILQINKRLETLRTVQKNIRSATEQIASDVREKWIDLSYYAFPHEILDYAGSGNIVLAIQWGIRYYPMKDSGSGPVICNENDLVDITVHCYLGKESGTERIAITDSSVRIDKIRFFLSWNTGDSITNLSQEGKATMVLSLGIEAKSGISTEMAKSSHLQIQTTISEKVYKKNISNTP